MSTQFTTQSGHSPPFGVVLFNDQVLAFETADQRRSHRTILFLLFFLTFLPPASNLLHLFFFLPLFLFPFPHKHLLSFLKPNRIILSQKLPTLPNTLSPPPLFLNLIGLQRFIGKDMRKRVHLPIGEMLDITVGMVAQMLVLVP